MRAIRLIAGVPSSHCNDPAEYSGGSSLAFVHIDNLAPGMVLKQNVCDRSGRLLLPEGSELTDRHLVIFRTWGVLEVDISSDTDGDDGTVAQHEEMDPALLAAAEAAVKPLFVHNDLDHPAIKELMRICIARKAAHDA
jgi:hypothetical protein